MISPAPVRHCAIYTRKSTEEGLEQGFNSLDAQREACQAYIISQKAEGWTVVKTEYDDGGFSGGNVERPGLKKMMEDIKAGKINIIVVYKIDRLTRSLMDFAKLVEIFDQYQVTFVSVTQSFNTTTSMGRLTLNVLLSFAQFEREVTGERIRDKIAASKKKGIWMGGNVPLGYEAKNRSLIIHPQEGALIRKIFESYIKLGSVLKLKTLLDQEGHKTKTGRLFTRGMLYWTISNPIYIGKLKHKNQVYDGEHQPIISQEVWLETQRKLAQHAVAPRGHKKQSHSPLLQGVLFDEHGTLYGPMYGAKGGQRYRYYVSRSKLQGQEDPESPTMPIPAQEIEDYVEKVLRQNIGDTKELSRILEINHHMNQESLKEHALKILLAPTDKIIKQIIQKIIVHKDSLTVKIKPAELALLLSEEGKPPLQNNSSQEIYTMTVPFQVTKSAWKGAVVIRPPAQNSPEDIFSLPPHELRDLVRGIVWRDQHFNGMTIREIAKQAGQSDVFIGRLIRNTLKIA